MIKYWRNNNKKIYIITLLTIIYSLYITTCNGSTDSSVQTITFSADIENIDIRRTIDIRGHVEEINQFIKVKNTGNKQIEYYIIAIPSSKLSHLSFVEALYRSKSTKKDESIATERVNVNNLDIPKTDEEIAFFALKFPQPLQPDDTTSFNIIASFTRTLRPFPSSIQQNDNQYVIYTDNVYTFSVYSTITQTTLIKLSSKKIESFTKKGSSHRGDEIEYGPFQNVAPFSYHILNIHYENNSPFVTATIMKKEIEVSHWGNIAITESYQLTHSGANLTGPYSRFEYQRLMNTAPSSFRELIAHLPYHASDIYFRDVIGNVSTSHVRKSKRERKTIMDVLPRYPMFGGWTADFHIGYNLPAHKYLFIDKLNPAHYLLNISFGSMFPNVAVDNAIIKVILPEGTQNIKWLTPFDIDKQHYESYLTHLDTSGRPVLVLHKSNVVRHHDQLFQVKYEFHKFAIFREPLLLMFVFFLLFLASMAYYRVDLGFHQKMA